MLAIRYASDDITGLTTENSKNITEFFPAKETDFNLAFGFIGRDLPPDIGYWKINHIKRHWNSDNTRSIKDHSFNYEVRKCNKDDEFKNRTQF